MFLTGKEGGIIIIIVKGMEGGAASHEHHE